MTFTRTASIGLGVVLIVGVTAVIAAQTRQGDWPNWRGPTHDGAIASFTEPATWPERLSRKWKVDVGLGYATPVLVGNRIYMFARQGENEVLDAIDTDTGKTIWQSSYAAPFTMNPAAVRHEKGPKSTPAFAGGKLFTLGISGIVSAFDAVTGKLLWQTPPPQEPPAEPGR